MALFPKTPGVYIEEIPRLPSSVAAVPTSVPVFIGYTQKAEKNGVSNALLNTPVYIESLLQFETIFGLAYSESFNVTLTGPSVNVAVAKVSAQQYRLYYHMLMYFGNGGGSCYVISIGDYSATIGQAAMVTGIGKAEQVDEITMVVIPESIALLIGDRLTVNNALLTHCAKMQDRFGLMDVLTNTGQTIALDAKDFRDNAVGPNNLSYGAAYYPSFKAAFPFSYVDTAVNTVATAANLPLSVQAFNSKSLAVINNGLQQVIDLDLNAYTLGTGSIVINGTSISLVGTLTVADVRDKINTFGGTFVSAVIPTTLIIRVTAITAGVVITITPAAGMTQSLVTSTLTPDKTLYNRIKQAVDAFALELYPSAMMAGIYCSVDTTRGVWKAPANVGVTLVDSLNRNIKDADQSDLNVDATSGKSIDVLRKFEGRGTLVWGARTLDGNSNEWRYISVRRTFLFIEDSCKKATMFSVFEPNDMNTWLRIQGMISSFLTTLWRDGALAGSKPDQAFFVKVGLGQTMTAQDILEGRLIVQIGLAVVRPAEFIILQFEHKLQEA